MFYKQIHRLPMYSSFLFQVIISDDIEKINKHLGFDEEEYYAVCYKTAHNCKNGNCNKGITVVLNPNCRDNKITAGIIAHECVHVKNMVFQAIGYKPKRSNDEAEAYFVEYLVNYVNDFYMKIINKEKQ